MGKKVNNMINGADFPGWISSGKAHGMGQDSTENVTTRQTRSTTHSFPFAHYQSHCADPLGSVVKAETMFFQRKQCFVRVESLSPLSVVTKTYIIYRE